MKIKLKKLYEGMGVLREVGSQTMPIKMSIKISKLMKAIFVEVEEIEKKRLELITKYKDDTKSKGQNITIKEDKIADFQKEFATILDEEIEIKIEKISIKEIETANINLTPIHLIALEDFIEGI